MTRVGAQCLPSAHGTQLSFADVDQLSLRLAFDVSLRDTTFVVVDLETTGGRAIRRRRRTSTRSPRSARSRCAAGRCSANWPHWSTPAAASRPRSSRSPASPRRWCATRPTIDAVLPAFLEFARGAVLVAHNAGFDIGFLRAAARALPDRLAAPAGAVHRPAGPPGADPRRGAQRAAGGAGPAVRRGHHADPPRARRRPRHRRRAARADRTGRQPGRAHLHRPARRTCPT